MNLPNKLTVLRIILVPIMVIIPFFNLQGTLFNISIEFIRNQVTTFGKFLDPIADKILVLAAMLILVEKQLLPAWIPIIVLTREFAVSAYRLIAVEQGGKVIAASIWGKLKTVTQMVAIVSAFIDINGTNSF